jgi:hypothetical protein
VGVLLGRDFGTVGEARAFATEGLVTDRGIRSEDTLGQVRLSYRDVTATNDGGTAENEWGVSFDGFNFNSGSNGDSHFDRIWEIYVGGYRCHS